MQGLSFRRRLLDFGIGMKTLTSQKRKKVLDLIRGLS